MQRRQQRTLKRNTEEIQKMLGDKKEKEEYLEEENCQEDLQQESYIDRQIRGMMRSTGQGQKETGDNGREDQLENKE